MKITQNAVVAIDYTLKNVDGEVIDQSEEGSPLYYLHGNGGIIVGLEEAIEGKETGAEVSVDIPADKAYGQSIEALIQTVPVEAFGDIKDIEVGMRFQAETEQGPVPVEVTAVADGKVTVDGNHPLAGLDLHFDVKVVEVREASAEEIEHGHVHGAGGHQH